MNSGRNYGKGAGKAPNGTLYEAKERINVFRKLFYGVGGLVARRMKTQRLLSVMKSITEKEEKWSLEECLVELKPTKPSECFMHLQEKNNRQLKGKSRRSPNPKCRVHKGH